VKTLQQFEANGCENCPFLEIKGQRDNALDCTTPSFEGLIGMMNHRESWVAKWQRISGQQFHKGCYAISVSGKLPRHIVKEFCEKKGIKYVSRDQNAS